MKKLSIFLLLTIMMLGMLTACSGRGNVSSTASPTPSASVAPTEPPTNSVSPAPSATVTPGTDVDDNIIDDDIIPDGNGPVTGIGGNDDTNSASPSPNKK